MAHHHRYRVRRLTPSAGQHPGCAAEVGESFSLPGQESVRWYCWRHASEHGFCPGCGSFVLGTEEGETLGHHGVCQDCQEEFEADQAHFDDLLDDDDRPDEFEQAMQDCHRLPNGLCLAAGSEQCEFECPFRE
jgi:hypothetical protein